MVIEYVYLTIIGVACGVLTGIIGDGAEVLVVPLLLFFHIFKDVKMAVGTSLAMLIPPVSLLAVIKYWKNKEVNVPYAAYLAIIFMIASYLSTNLGLKLKDSLIRKIYSVFLLTISILKIY